MPRLHIDTDFAGDPDDACAVAMVLGWPEAELTGITTTADPDGRRAGYLTRFLELAGRADILVAAGAGRSLTTDDAMGGIPDHDACWGPPPVAARPGPLAAALDLLAASIDAGATIAAIGPLTNLALLHAARPGRLTGVPVVAMAGWLASPGAGPPGRGPAMDWNVQCDTAAAALVADQARLTLANLPVALNAQLRAADLPRLAASGPLGELLARQSAAHGREYDMAGLGRAHPGRPDDLVNIHWDPVACAVALGWPGAVLAEQRLRTVVADGVLRFEPAADGRATRVLTGLDGAAFSERWLTAVEAASTRAWPAGR